MSTLTDLRDLISAAHVNAGTLVGKQVSVLDGTNYPAVLFSGLYAVVRGLTKREERRVMELGIRADRIIEIARQSSFTGAGVEPSRYVVKWGDEEYQITDVMTDDTESAPSSGEQPGVFVFTAVRRGGGLGAGGIN